MKTPSKIFRGIEYIQVSSLPEPQRRKLQETINQNVLIKILMDGKIVSDCLQYKDYEFWYENIYHPSVEKMKAGSQPQPADTNVIAR